MKTDSVTPNRADVAFRFDNQGLYTSIDTIQASVFGVTADYNGSTGTDNRNALQLAINYCSVNKKILKLPSGRMLLNSFANTRAAIAHGNILELKSNLTIIGNKSEIVVGSYFNDKNFIVMSGFDSPQTEGFSIFTNVVIKHLTINFNASKSLMQTKYLLRKGIELGHCINGEVAFCKFYNGDISCGIATGFGNKNISTNIQIHHNEFQNLASSSKNIDHTSVYLNSNNSTIYKNNFFNNLIQGRLVSCAAELHNSETKFLHNNVLGYTRMLFLAATVLENKNIFNLVIASNKAEITNAGIYLWLESNTSFDGILIDKNSFISNHVDGYPMVNNGTQGILADARDDANTAIKNMVISNNKTVIKNSIIKGRAVNYSTKYNFINIKNKCTGCKDGLFYK